MAACDESLFLKCQKIQLIMALRLCLALELTKNAETNPIHCLQRKNWWVPVFLHIKSGTQCHKAIAFFFSFALLKYYACQEIWTTHRATLSLILRFSSSGVLRSTNEYQGVPETGRKASFGTCSSGTANFCTKASICENADRYFKLFI